MFPSPFHILAILKLAPVLYQKSEEMHSVRTFCSSIYSLKRVRWPPFLFHGYNKNSAFFRWEKNWHKSKFSFLAILLNCTDWTRTGGIVRVKIKSTLERKVETRAFKGTFLVRRWINNTFRSNSVRYHMHHRNLSFLASFGLLTVFAKGS